MVLMHEKLNEKDVVVGKIYPKELINFYCKEYDCALVKLNPTVKPSTYKGLYLVKDIINDADMIINKDFNSNAAYKKKVIIIERN